jgi:hypothetical protein
MKRLAFLVLPAVALAACDSGIPTAMDNAEDLTAAALVVPIDPVEPDAVPAKVNLATATTIQLVVPNTTLVPTLAEVTTSDGYSDAESHTINEGCPTHFQDVDGDDLIDLVLHFDVDALFPYAPDAVPTDPITLTISVTFVDESTFTADYLVQLVYNTPKRKGSHGRP